MKRALLVVLPIAVAACADGTEPPSTDGANRAPLAAADTPPEAPAADSSGIVRPTSTSVKIDGRECADESTTRWATLGVYDDWWMLYLSLPRCNAMLHVSGKIGAPYPQVGAMARDGQEVLKVFTRLDGTTRDEHVLSHVSREAHPSTIDEGAIAGAPAHRVAARGALAQSELWREYAPAQPLPATVDVVVDVQYGDP